MASGNDSNMTVAPVYKQGWTMDDVRWSLFDPTRVDPSLLATVKAAALVEYTAPDYVCYLKRIFANAAGKRPSMAAPWGAGPRPPIPASSLRKPLPVFARDTAPPTSTTREKHPCGVRAAAK